MNRRLRLLALAVVGALIAAGTTACSSTLSDAATVTYHDSTGKHVVHITRDDFETQLQQFVGSKHFPDLLRGNTAFAPLGDGKNVTNANITARYLQQLISNVTWEQEFDRLHLPVTAADRAQARHDEALAFALESELQHDASGQIAADATGRPILIGSGVVFNGFPKSLQDKLVDRQAKVTAVEKYYTTQPTPAALQDFYTTYARDICPSGRVVGHILVKDKATADQLYAQLQQGASFQQLAQSKSIDPGSAKNGGLLGCLKQGEFVKPFEDAALRSSPGIPTTPVKSQFGYHIILTDPANYATLQSDTQTAFKNGDFLLYRLLGEHVSVNPRYGTVRLTSSQQGVPTYAIVAPGAPAPRDVRENSRASDTTVPAG